MDEELEARAPDHEPVPAGAAELVAKRAATALAPGRMPAIYPGHGAPPLVDDPLWVIQLEAWARARPRPLSTGAPRRALQSTTTSAVLPSATTTPGIPPPVHQSWPVRCAGCCRGLSRWPTSRAAAWTTVPTCR